MRVLVFEYVTGGGFLDRSFPEGLTQEGDLMLRALAADLSALGHEVITLRDARLPPWPGPGRVSWLHHSRELAPALRRQIAACDAAWPIAPESGGELERLAQAVLDGGCTLLGCRPEAIRVAAGKFKTIARLAAHGIPVVPTCRGTAVLAGQPLPFGPWVVKPDDGAGCEQTRLIRDRSQLHRYLAQARHPADVTVQPYTRGVDASLSVLAGDGDGGVRLLACNRQRIAVADDQFRLLGCEVGALTADWAKLQQLAESVVRAIPGLWGYVGVDLLLTPDGPLVLEVNPRLTTSYVGLGDSLGENPAGLVLGLLAAAPRAPAPAARAPRPVWVNLEEGHGG